MHAKAFDYENIKYMLDCLKIREKAEFTYLLLLTSKLFFTRRRLSLLKCIIDVLYMKK